MGVAVFAQPSRGLAHDKLLLEQGFGDIAETSILDDGGHEDVILDPGQKKWIFLVAWRGCVKVAVGASPEAGVLTGALQVHLADGGRGVAVLPQVRSKGRGFGPQDRAAVRVPAGQHRHSAGRTQGHLAIGGFEVDALLDEGDRASECGRVRRRAPESEPRGSENCVHR